MFSTLSSQEQDSREEPKEHSEPRDGELSDLLETGIVRGKETLLLLILRLQQEGIPFSGGGLAGRDLLVFGLSVSTALHLAHSCDAACPTHFLGEAHLTQDGDGLGGESSLTLFLCRRRRKRVPRLSKIDKHT